MELPDTEEEEEVETFDTDPTEERLFLRGGCPSSHKGGFVDEPERKYVFECSCQEQCDEWVKALTNASYEFMRRSLMYYRNEILRLTGKDPLEQYGISEESRFQMEPATL